MRLWIDDIRTPPDDTWVWAKTYDEAIRQIDQCIAEGTKIEMVSFDHDLGEPSQTEWPSHTGYGVACHIEELVYNGFIRCPAWQVHSANPVGRTNIENAMRAAERMSR